MQIYKFKTLNSTNIYAKNVIEESKLTAPFAILALEQTMGKGRYGRDWISQNGNLFLSIVISANDLAKNLGFYSLISTLSIANVIEKYINDKSLVKIKWPNDLLIDNKKICGILIEYLDKQKSLIIGIGLNIENFPTNGNLIYPATCLKDYKIEINQEDLAQEIIEKFEINLQLIKDNKFDFIKDEWLDRAFKLNQKITINISNRSFSGVFIGINDNAELIVEHEARNGQTMIETVNFADVF